MKTQNNTSIASHHASKSEDSSNLSAKLMIPKVPRKTLKRYKEIEEELEKIRRETDSQDTRLLKIQNNSRQIEDEYSNKKKDVENKLMELSRRKQGFSERQKRAKEALDQEKDRVKKIENKKNTELVRLGENIGKIKDLEDERLRKDSEREILLKRKEALEVEVTKLKKYEEFLIEVMKQSPDFLDEAESPEGPNVQNLIAKNLKVRNNKKKFEDSLEQIDVKKEGVTEEFQKYKKDMEESILTATSELYRLQEKIEELSQEKSRAEGEINSIEERTNEETAKWSQIIMAVGNLHMRALEAKELQDFDKRKDKDPAEGGKEKKNSWKKWEDLTTDNLIDDLQQVEDQIKFLAKLQIEIEKKKKQNNQ